MSGSVGFSVELDRDNNVFDVIVDYTVDGYNDPETGEYFGNTSWTYQFNDLDNETGGSAGGYASESDSVWIGVGLGPDVLLRSYTLSFTAMNTFSGGTASLDLSIFSVANATDPQHVDGTAGMDLIVGGNGEDELDGLAGNDYLDAGGSADLLAGGAGGDILIGGAGADTMAGGADNDLYYVDQSDDVIEELAGEGLDTVRTSSSFTLAANVEQLVLVGIATIGGVGNIGANRMDGNEANNALEGRGGNDDLRGNGGRDSLLGGGGDDTLSGGTDLDMLAGGTGNDTYHISSPQQDRIVELADAGIDTVEGHGLTNYRLPDNVESFITRPTVFPDFAPGIRITGNELHNSLYGGGGNDTLVGGLGSDWLEGLAGQDLFLGGAGSDELRGGYGIDTVSYRASAEAVVVWLQRSEGHGGDAEGDRIRGVENVIGSDFDDQIIGILSRNLFNGGAGDDTIDGSWGDDTIIGGSGADAMTGGGGRDLLNYVGSTGGALVIDLDAGTVSGGDGEGDYITGFEDASGGTGDDSITGSAIGNVLRGGAGLDTINGGAGNDTIAGGGDGDTLSGGAGFDTLSYAGSPQGVSVALDEPNPGDQHAVGGDATDDSLSGFENIIGGLGDDTLYGGLGGNRLAGGAGADSIDGNAGNDTVSGGAGADTLSGGAGIDTLSYAGARTAVTVYLGDPDRGAGDATGDEFSGFENLEGGAGNDYLVGDAGANRLIGGKGYDALAGDAGDDTLFGGADGDAFVYGGGQGNDTILDFSAADTLSLSFGLEFDTVEEVMAAAHSAGSDDEHTVFDFGDAGTLTLLNMRLEDFPVDNIFF